MKRRCYEENNKDYFRYGGRGIIVCFEWMDKNNGFMNFYNWAMQNGYDDTLTLDRIDVNGNYEPSNCKWSTIKEQNTNTRVNRFITYRGETKTLSQWAEEYEMIPETLSYRLNNKIDFETAVSTKDNMGCVYVEYDGDVYTLKELSNKFCVPYGTVKYRHRRGWSVYDIINTPIDKRNRKVVTQ